MPTAEKLLKTPTPQTGLVELLGLTPENLTTRPATGGHMAYRRYFIADSEVEYFVKAHDSSRFTDKAREENSKQYLVKEAAYMRQVGEVAGNIVPEVHGLVNDTLILESLSEERGWYWRAPVDFEQRERYIKNVLSVFRQLEGLEQVADCEVNSQPTTDVFLNDGWRSFGKKKPKLYKKVANWTHRLSSENRKYFGKLVNDVMQIDLEELVNNIEKTKKKRVLSHHDARQANIAWHPEHGVRLVDWSWADQGTPGADSTMFLIDLSKSGYDVSEYMSDHFDSDHAMLLLGYYLSRSLDPQAEGNEEVRFHQFASALTTYRLLVDFSIGHL